MSKPYKFKEGDFVYIKDDAKSIHKNDPLNFNREGKMDQYLGTVQEISRRYIANSKYNRYILKNLSNGPFEWIWAEDWLEPIDSHDIDIEEDAISSLLME